MVELSNEMLMAHADGELDFSERARVEAILATDPSSRARLQMFKATGRSLADHFPMNEPVPQRLIDLILGRSAKTAAAARKALAIGGRSRFSALLGHIKSAGEPHWQSALAYTTVLLIAAATGWYLHEATTRTPVASEAFIFIDNGRILAQGALWRTLETAPSGVQVAATGLEQVASVQVRLTFKSRQHGFCRQYELALRIGSHFAGIGCRGDDASWQVQIHTPNASNASARSGRITAADGNESALAAVVGHMIDGDALGVADEATLIGKQWRP